VLQVTETNRAIAAEQKLALASERERAGALAQELASVRNQLEAANRQFAALTASRALTSREPAVDSPLERVAQFYLKITEGKSRWPEQTSVQAAASNSERSSASELPPEAQSTARESAPELDPQVPVVSEGSASASAAPRPLVDEQRLLARANALLRQADISGARPLLEHAVDRGSARAAFMLAETYDARVLQSWRARGIPGDLTKARELYERAQAGGIEDAKERIKMLK
jgi:TPR repeat protein